MKINHLNLTVTDVDAAAAFLEKYFGLQPQGGDSKFTVLFNDNGMVLSLMKAGQVKYPGTFRIGFMQANEAQVDALNQRLRDDGFDVPASTFMRGRFMYKHRVDSRSKCCAEGG